MKRKIFDWKFTAALMTVVLFAVTGLQIVVSAQTGGLRREEGMIFSQGTYLDFTAGAAIAANEMVYLDSAGKVQKAPTSGQTTTIIGVARNACANAATNCAIQITGLATAIADGTVAINDTIGAPTSTAGRAKTITATIADSRLILGVAQSAASAGETFSLLLTRKGAGIAGTSGGVPYYSSASTIASSAALTANSPVLGGGAGAAPTTVAGITSDGTSKITLGVAGTSVGSVDFKNATSGTVTLAPVTGALGTVTLSLPATTDTLVGKTTTDTLTNKTLTAPVIGAATGTSLDLTGSLNVGVAGTGVGSVVFENATSGTITKSPVTGALGTIAQSVPAVAGTEVMQLGTTVTLTNVDLDTTDNSIAAHVCEDQSVTATGLTATDNIAWIMTTSDLAVTFNVQLHTPGTDTIVARVCNNSAAGADPGAVADFRIMRLMP